MSKLSRKDLYSLEEYSEIRDEFRARVIAHKKNRRLDLGENVVLFFEDRLVMHYQVQEMLKAEKIFDAEGIQEELDAYNPLIPDGTNWKATLMIQYADVAERQQMLLKLVGIENRIWIRVNDMEKVYAIADEDLERTTEEKTSAVHFLRFELTPSMIAEIHKGGQIAAGVDHENYPATVDRVADNVVRSLASDLHSIQ
ncbi:MAG: DUF3501 family protein [Gammaproteobacteria bacterium]|nr:DUF3501 family protein [Gammaproteobacteria bacterium]NNJ95917.1 DUF3501 family protein [Gammaproteobacteria bacterium]